MNEYYRYYAKMGIKCVDEYGLKGTSIYNGLYNNNCSISYSSFCSSRTALFICRCT